MANRNTITAPSNRFAMLSEEEEGVAATTRPMPPTAPVRAASFRSAPPLPKILGGGGGGGGGGTESGSYSERLRARKANGATTAAPNIASEREFPTLGGGGGKAAATSSSSLSASWASKAHACAEHDAREKEAKALADAERAYREALDRTQFVGSRMFQRKAATGPTVADYEEEDRLRGLLGTHDSYSYDYSYRPAETGSHTPPYPPYDEEGEAPAEE
jgi:hypothetical protein